MIKLKTTFTDHGEYIAFLHHIRPYLTKQGRITATCKHSVYSVHLRLNVPSINNRAENSAAVPVIPKDKVHKVFGMLSEQRRDLDLAVALSHKIEDSEGDGTEIAVLSDLLEIMSKEIRSILVHLFMAITE